MSRFSSIKGRFGGGKGEESVPGEGDSADVVRATSLPFMRSLDLRSSKGERQRRRLKVKPSQVVLAGAIPVAAIIVGLLYVSAAAQADDAEAERDAVATQVEDAQQRALAVTAQEDLLNAVASAGESTLTASVASSLSSRIAWDRVLTSVSKIRPSGTWYTDLNGGEITGPPASAAPEEADAAGAPASSSQLSITGFSLDHDRIAKLVSRMNTIRDIESVDLSTTGTSTIGDQEVIQFEIVARVRGSR